MQLKGGASPVPDTCGYVDVKLNPAVPSDDLSVEDCSELKINYLIFLIISPFSSIHYNTGFLRID